MGISEKALYKLYKEACESASELGTPKTEYEFLEAYSRLSPKRALMLKQALTAEGGPLGAENDSEYESIVREFAERQEQHLG